MAKLFKSKRGLVCGLSGLVFIGAGLTHFAIPESYAKIVPPALPIPRELVYISGIFEILGGIGLLVPKTRRAAGYGLAALLIAVYPANIYHALSKIQLGGMLDHPAYHWIRLPLQPLFVWVVLWCSQHKPPTQD